MSLFEAVPCGVHLSATFADLLKRGATPRNLRDARDRNDGTLERINFGRRFIDGAKRLERLVGMYTKMTKHVLA